LFFNYKYDDRTPFALVSSGSSQYELALMNLHNSNIEVLLTVD